MDAYQLFGKKLVAFRHASMLPLQYAVFWNHHVEKNEQVPIPNCDQLKRL